MEAGAEVSARQEVMGLRSGLAGHSGRTWDVSIPWSWRRLLRVFLDSKKIKPVNPKGDKP